MKKQKYNNQHQKHIINRTLSSQKKQQQINPIKTFEKLSHFKISTIKIQIKEKFQMKGKQTLRNCTNQGFILKDYHLESSFDIEVFLNQQIKSSESSYKAVSSSLNLFQQIKKTSDLSPVSSCNFIKNLIKVIQTWVSLDKMKQKNDEGLDYLWKIFSASKKSNKTLLRLVYGGSSESQNSIKALFQEFGEQAYFEKSGYQSIIEYQTYFRIQTVRILTEANISHIIKNRRVHNKPELQSFLCQFLSQLREGDLRLNYRKSHH